MTEFVMLDAFVEINSVDLSDHVRSVTLNYESELQDKTAMGDTAREFLGGLKNWSLDLEMNSDFAAASVDATLFPLVGTTFTVTVRPDKSDGVSPTNPNFTGTGILGSYPPFGGTIGELAITRVTIQSSGTLTRATA